MELRLWEKVGLAEVARGGGGAVDIGRGGGGGGEWREEWPFEWGRERERGRRVGGSAELLHLIHSETHLMANMEDE